MDAPWILRAPPSRLAAGQILVIVAVALTGATLGLELVHTVAGGIAAGLLSSTM